MFRGLSAFSLTPTDSEGRVQTDPLGALLNRIRTAGADSIGLLGSTGGYAFLTRDERRRAVEAAVEAVGGRMPIIVGVGALRTDEALALAGDARKAGADGLLLAPMSYTPLMDEEVFQHIAAVAEAGDLPLCIYNNPGTTKFVFSEDLIVRLAQLPNIRAVKMPLPADGDFAGELARLRARTPDGFAIGYSGDWGAADALLAGGDAWYSVAAGLLPGPVLKLARAAGDGEVAETRRLDAAFQPLWQLFREFGSFRVMYVIADLLGLGQFQPPRPILPLAEAVRPRVEAALRAL
nr:dihydrodipicolinate synthase family protein [Ancylobacter sp. Lp-2]